MFKVECYTSSKLNERPVAFVLSNSRYKVEEIIDRWYGEGSRYFKINCFLIDRKVKALELFCDIKADFFQMIWFCERIPFSD